MPDERPFRRSIPQASYGRQRCIRRFPHRRSLVKFSHTILAFRCRHRLSRSSTHCLRIAPRGRPSTTGSSTRWNGYWSGEYGDFRYQQTPPELFPIAMTGVDGGHFGYLIHAPELCPYRLSDRTVRADGQRRRVSVGCLDVRGGWDRNNPTMCAVRRKWTTGNHLLPHLSGGRR